MDSRIPEPKEQHQNGTITRREFMRRAALLAALLGLLLSSLSGFLAACAPGATPTEAPEPTEAPPEPKILRIRLGNDISNVDPAFHPAMADTIVLGTTGEGLVSFKPGTWDLVNVLVESIDQSEDGLQIDFKLKEGIQFHGGYGELTAEDVKYSYERFIDPELDAPYKGDWAQLDRVEVTGTYIGTIYLKEPFAPLWFSALPVGAGVIVSKKAIEDKGLEAYATSPVGTGPYEFAEWVPNQRIVLKRFEDYWGDKPEWDEIHFIPITEDSAAEIALETGEVDFGSIAEEAVERFEANDDFAVIDVTTMNFSGILMNVQHPNLEDINVRQAIRYGIDVPSIIEGAYDGKAVRACAALAPGVMGYWENAPCYERDVEKARGFMEKAGLETLDLILTVPNDEQSRAIAEIVQANLAEIGINVEILAEDEATYWDGGFGEEGLKNRQLTLIAWTTPNPDPSWITIWFICDQVLQWNWMYWCSEEFDNLHHGAVMELDPTKRAEMYVELQKVWDEAANVVWTVHPMLYFAASTDLEPSLNPAGILIPWNFRSK